MLNIVWDGLFNKLFLASLPIFISFLFSEKETIKGIEYSSSSKLYNCISLVSWFIILILHSVSVSSKPIYSSFVGFIIIGECLFNLIIFGGINISFWLLLRERFNLFIFKGLLFLLLFRFDVGEYIKFNKLFLFILLILLFCSLSISLELLLFINNVFCLISFLLLLLLLLSFLISVKFKSLFCLLLLFPLYMYFLCIYVLISVFLSVNKVLLYQFWLSFLYLFLSISFLIVLNIKKVFWFDFGEFIADFDSLYILLCFLYTKFFDFAVSILLFEFIDLFNKFWEEFDLYKLYLLFVNPILFKYLVKSDKLKFFLIILLLLSILFLLGFFVSGLSILKSVIIVFSINFLYSLAFISEMIFSLIAL